MSSLALVVLGMTAMLTMPLLHWILLSGYDLKSLLAMNPSLQTSGSRWKKKDDVAETT